MRLYSAVLCGTLMAVGYSGAAMAHHSFAMFDRSKSVVLDGTVKSVQLINPHALFVLTAAGPDGVVRDWNLEGPSPNILIRQGWKHSDISSGDRVTMTFNPLKDGSDGGVLVTVRLAGGKELSAIPAGAPASFFAPQGAPKPADAPKGAPK